MREEKSEKKNQYLSEKESCEKKKESYGREEAVRVNEVGSEKKTCFYAKERDLKGASIGKKRVLVLVRFRKALTF